jgi:hypothetical protein
VKKRLRTDGARAKSPLRSKSRSVAVGVRAQYNLVSDCISLLEAIGIPLSDRTKRRKERIAKAVLAVAGLEAGMSWGEVKSDADGHRLTSRQILKYMNSHFSESIADSSYDDIRRKDLALPVAAGMVLRSAGNEKASTNDGTRAYALSPEYADLMKTFHSPAWSKALAEFMLGRKTLADEIAQRRARHLVPVRVGDKDLEFTPGIHSELQRAIIEKFLPVFGFGAEVAYVGDPSNKSLYLNEELLNEINLFELKHELLPDVIAYSRERNWLFLIEAVHTSNPFDFIRKKRIADLAENCTAGLVFVSAFLTRDAFRRFIKDIAWETEVWIAESPDHMVHFNGDRFMGPH